MVEEVQQLLASGIPVETLVYYGLEYKYIAQYLSGNLTYDEMFRQLNTAIHQFAKRQRTWFRKMEKEGAVIHWLEGRNAPGRKSGNGYPDWSLPQWQNNIPT